MLRKKYLHAKTYALVAIATASLLVLTVMILNPTSITFKSKATEKYSSNSSQYNASASLDLPLTQLPSCVKRLSYIPETSDSSCLVSIQCLSDSAYSPQNVQNNCRYQDSIYSCYVPQCFSNSEWIKKASAICGCSGLPR